MDEWEGKTESNTESSSGLGMAKHRVPKGTHTGGCELQEGSGRAAARGLTPQLAQNPLSVGYFCWFLLKRGRSLSCAGPIAPTAIPTATVTIYQVPGTTAWALLLPMTQQQTIPLPSS